MSLQAPEFFAELCLPFHDSTVVGTTYYAVPVPDSPLRLRISFTGTKHADTYGGLRLAVVHADKGEIDSVALSFLDHGTFHRRDEATRTSPNTKQHGTFDKSHRPGRPPWDGAVTTGLRDAIQHYSAVWFPGAWAATAPSRAAGPTTHKAPLPTSPSSGRAR
ncbi:hypothetical protein [Streptomyces sp. Wh19]|uniref:hypothetical protein n=1 Tax=Streptomyces sp. Wh19 TaxID=3076629 RepID=UPI0029587554|nr:hypothetical protein [Streptomyces sp. Wh19]MDV9194362.1 hypothetical protein [Streptomyces sp. Wh19]